GLASLIPLLDEILNDSESRGATEAVIGMSHRGRLNVMVHIVGTPPVSIFAEFEDVDPRSVLGGGDVKYHIGATGKFAAKSGGQIQMRLVSGPSHLEAVDSVMMGRVRAKQTRIGQLGAAEILPILIHGDAGFAGQGIAAEALNLANLNGFTVGGTLHIIANNLIGFTSTPEELYSSRFSSDVAKRLPIPIFHVNSEDPDAVVRVGRIASEYRSAFSSDVVIDLIGFRRHGHSEIDDPTITQPLLYDGIKEHSPLWKLYAQKIGENVDSVMRESQSEFKNALDQAATLKKMPQLSELPDYWNKYAGGPYSSSLEVDTGISLEEMNEMVNVLTSVPDGFALHPKVKRVLDKRADMGKQKIPVDFGMAELLAFGSLLRHNIPVRLSGQDSRRGTFAQRQAVYFDTKTGNEYIPLSHLKPQQGRFEIYNSMLSEAAVLGFEYGFSREYPDALVLWEAQFGDFVNGAQVIIDQFISAGEDKWGLLSGVTLLLPHGYEGQGPEHSSARMERFLQLAAEDNIQICQPSNAAQYFHLLRRQALRSWRKPLIVFTPKSILHVADAGSQLEEFTHPRFLSVLPESEVNNAERVLICTGKIGRALRIERTRRRITGTAIVFVEQLYPFPEEELAAELNRHQSARELVWVQEEPANMGALHYILPLLGKLAGNLPIRSIKRSASASPATGSAKAHELEQKAILSLALGAHEEQ
ncbi:MAG: 2-oxoglutarate dehydrogenase E1 component, partial [Bacteroidota bacterium]